MKKVNKKIILNFSLIGIFIISLISLVNAFGIASVYSENNLLKLYPGETKEIQLFLGTTEAEGNLIIKAEMVDDAGIAELTDSNLVYNVNFGQPEVPVNVKIRLGEEVSVGEEKIILIKFSDITPVSGGGMIPVRSVSTTTLNVKVVEKPVTPTTETPQEEGIGLGWWILGIVVIIIIVLIIYFIIKSRRK